jgi:hypothetical protein
MYLKYNREEITWIDQKFLTKEIAQDLAGFWVDTSNNNLYCARNTEIGVGHYYFDKNSSEWILDYFPEFKSSFEENKGIVKDFDQTNSVILDNNTIGLLDAEDKILYGKVSIDKTIEYFINNELLDAEFPINKKLFTFWIYKKATQIAYYGNLDYIVFDKEILYSFLKAKF